MEEKEKIVFDVRFFSAVFSPLCYMRKKRSGKISQAKEKKRRWGGGKKKVTLSIREGANCQGYISTDDWCEAGFFCQPVTKQECLMFSLLVTLLCIFLCQHYGPIWTAKALQSPAGHLSSSWRCECSASAECQGFVMTWEPADRQVCCKKDSFLSHCENINVPIMAYNCQRGLPPDSCVVSLICSPVTCFLEFRFSYGVTCKQVTICRPVPGGTW